MSFRLKGTVALRTLILFPFLLALLSAQDWDPGARATTAIVGATDERLKLTFEVRGRYEDRTGNNFGKDVDVFTGLFRTRLGLSYTPVKWIKFSGMVQDSRAPWYGPGAPNTIGPTYLYVFHTYSL